MDYCLLASAEVDALGRAMDDEDWHKIWQASGLARVRSAMECRLRWLNDCRPGLEKGGWSAEATQRLLKLTEEHGLHAVSKVSCVLTLMHANPPIHPEGCIWWEILAHRPSDHELLPKLLQASAVYASNCPATASGVRARCRPSALM